MSVSLALLGSILLPLAGAAAIVLIGSAHAPLVRRIALMCSLATLALAVYVLAGFDASGDAYMHSHLEQLRAAAESGTTDGVAPFDARRTAYALTEFSWLPPASGFDVRFSFGLDGLSVWMYGLSAVLMLSSVLVSWTAVQQREALYY